MKTAIPLIPLRSPSRQRPPARGFTLVEVITAVSILAIVTVSVTPSFQSFIAGQRVKSAAYDLTAALLLARNEALKRNGSVKVARAGSNWNTGWTVAVVADNTSVGDHNGFDSTLTFGGAPDSIVFNANGRVSSPTSPVQIRLASSAASSSVRCIALALSGQARSTVGECP